MSDYAQAQYIIDEVCGVNGLPPNNMKSITATPGNQKAMLYFTEPDNTIIDGCLLCTVKGVVVVRKEGSMPESMTDGVVVLRNENLGAYETEPFADEGLENDREYYYRFFPYSVHNVYNLNYANVAKVTPTDCILYGFRINKSDSNPATRIEYLEQAAGMTPAKMDYDTGKFDYGSWNPDEIWFLKDNYPAMVKYDGTEDYKLDPDDYTKKADGSASDVSNASYEGNAMAKIPLVWLYQYEDDTHEYCYISNKQVNENYHAYAHQRKDGTIMDYIWLSCFESVLVDSKARSIAGLMPETGQTAGEEITAATNNGDLWYTRTWSQRNLINMLLLLMSRSDDSQTSFGCGLVDDLTDCVSTGSAMSGGRFFGRDIVTDVVKVFHLENWWGNVGERIAGFYVRSSSEYVQLYATASTVTSVNGKIICAKMTPSYNLEGNGYSTTGAVTNSAAGYCSETKMTKYGRLPVSMSGSSATYTCDYIPTVGIHTYAVAGGGSGYESGMSQLDLSNDATATGSGYALSCEQP